MLRAEYGMEHNTYNSNYMKAVYRTEETMNNEITALLTIQSYNGQLYYDADEKAAVAYNAHESLIVKNVYFGKRSGKVLCLTPLTIGADDGAHGIRKTLEERTQEFTHRSVIPAFCGTYKIWKILSFISAETHSYVNPEQLTHVKSIITQFDCVRFSVGEKLMPVHLEGADGRLIYTIASDMVTYSGVN